MSVTLNSISQNQNSRNKANQPSFAADVKISRAAKKALTAELTREYMFCNEYTKKSLFGEGALNASKLINNFVSSLENATKNIKNVVIRIVMDRKNPKKPMLTIKKGNTVYKFCEDGKPKYLSAFGLLHDKAVKENSGHFITLRTLAHLSEKSGESHKNNPLYLGFMQQKTK